MLGFKRVKANIRSECYFCVFRYCLFLIRYCIKCPFRFFFTIVNKHLFCGNYLVILVAKRRNVQYLGYKYVISNGRGCSFLICALIGSLGCLPFFSLADDTTWFWCYDIQSKSALKRSLFPVCSENEMVANHLTKRRQ